MKLNTKIVVPCLMVLALTQASILFVHRVMTNGDNLDYLLIAGLVLRGEVLEPFHWRFPVGYPYAIAAFCKISSITIGTDPLSISTASLYAVKGVGVLMAPFAALAVWLWCHAAKLDERVALAITALFSTTQQLAPVYSVIGAEPGFMILSWLALLGWESTLRRDANVSWRWLWLVMICTAGSILFRQIGLAIPLAVMGGLILMKNRHDLRKAKASFCCALLILVAGILLTVFSNPSHLNQLSNGRVPETGISGMISGKTLLIFSNVEAYRMTIPQLLLPKVFGSDGLLSIAGVSSLQWPIVVTIYVCCALGLMECLVRRNGGTVTAVYFLITVTIILVWPYTDGRFLLPLIPALWAYTIAGIFLITRALRIREDVKMKAFAIAAVFLLIWQVSTNAFAGIKNAKTMYTYRNLPAWHPVRYELTGEIDFADHLDCGMWLLEHAEQDSVVFGEKSTFLALASGHKAFYLRELLDDLSSGKFADERAPYYVVVDGFPITTGYGKAKLEFVAIMESLPLPAYEPVYEAPHGARIYKRQPDINRAQ